MWLKRAFVGIGAAALFTLHYIASCFYLTPLGAGDTRGNYVSFVHFPYVVERAPPIIRRILLFPVSSVLNAAHPDSAFVRNLSAYYRGGWFQIRVFHLGFAVANTALWLLAIILVWYVSRFGRAKRRRYSKSAAGA